MGGGIVSEFANRIRELHEETGAGYLDCKRALEKAGGNRNLAASSLHEKGIALARKKAARLTKTGIVDAYIHTGSRIGVMIELYCETDFAASTEVFRRFARDMAMHIAAANPSSIDDLLNQEYYRDPARTVNDMLLDCVVSLKENVAIRRFVRYETGEENE